MNNHEVNQMTNNETKALVTAIQIIYDLSPTKEIANELVEKIKKELSK